MLKGKSVIELTDVKTGQKEVYEDTNLVTEAVQDVLNVNLMGMLYNNTSFDGSSGDNWLLPINKNIMGGILLYQNPIEERTDNLYAPLDNPLIGYASDDANNTEDVRRGSRNLTESKVIDGGYRFVWDFQTSQGNGTISAICLTNTLAGQGTQYANNYMVRISSASCAEDQYATDLYQDNKRLFIEEGYRLEMTTYHDSNQAILRKFKDDFLHASLTDRPLTRVVLEPEEETTIDLGHYPLSKRYTGGSKDGTIEPYSTSHDIRNYLYHAADGKWYGLSRMENYNYTSTSGGKDQYSRVSYDWYVDAVDGTQCTSQRIIAPSDITSFTSIGMSGKWLMCYTGSKLYRIDTTNVANIEQIPDFTYVSDNTLTYIVDDDIVINGWYFLNGEPKLYLRQTASSSHVAWGYKQLARYKTFAVREWVYSYYGYYVYKDLCLYTPYLATINNLGTPVIKTADKTMKITYTITEE